MPDESTMDDVAVAEAASTDEQSNDESSDSGEGGEQKKRRRRRRGGRKRGKRKDGDGAPEGEASADDSKAENPDGGDGGDGGSKKKRRRRSRRGGKDRDDRPPQTEEEAGEIGGRRRSGAPADHTNAEIFAESTFEDLGLRNSVLKGLDAVGFKRATYIQAKLIPAVLAGKDSLGQAKTGSGKTAAFGLPLFHMATRDLPFQSVVLCPTRELAIQIADELNELGKFTPIKATPVYGGQAIPTQVKRLEQNPEILVATPGRLMDLFERRHLHFDNIKFVVLDEVDRMLDIGFRDDIKKILSKVRTEHQTVFVSATISDEIESLARQFMKKDVEKIVTAAGSLTVDLVEQHYLTVQRWDKKRLLTHLLTHEDPDLTLVFCRTKRMVDDLTRHLVKQKIDAHAIHGDMHQGKRNSVMKRLRHGQLGVLVASDLAARGLDVDDITHVVNYDLPEDPEIYIHRIGRTARAGRGGIAWSLVTPDEGHLLTQVEKLANVEIPQMEYPDFEESEAPRRVREEKAAAERKTEELKATKSRTAGPKLPTQSAQPNAAAFPGGVVPTKLPPKMMGGRVRTARSMKQTPPPPPSGEEGDKSS